MRDNWHSHKCLNHRECQCSLSLRIGKGQRLMLITVVFSNMRWQQLKDTPSWLSCKSMACAPRPWHLFVFLGVCPGLHSNVQSLEFFLFMAYLPTTGTCTDHNLKPACLLSYVTQPSPPTPTQLPDKHLGRDSLFSLALLQGEVS